MTSFTIDLQHSDRDDRWSWRLYNQGGGNYLSSGFADTLEAASAEARTEMIVRSRQGDDA